MLSCLSHVRHFVTLWTVACQGSVRFSRQEYWSELPCPFPGDLSLSIFTFMHWRRKWQPTPVFLPGESQGRGSLVDCCLWGRTESDTTEATYQQHTLLSINTFGCKLVQPISKTVWSFLKKLRRELPYDPVIPLLDLHIQKKKT